MMMMMMTMFLMKMKMDDKPVPALKPWTMGGWTRVCQRGREGITGITF